jgi:hypothetical protein
MPPPADNRSLGELMAELSRETGTLFRQELELAKTELSAKAAEAGGHVATASAGGALVHAGLLVLLAAIVIALAQLGIPAWIAAGLVALLTMGIGYALLNMGMSKLRRQNLAPRNTIETLKETTTWTTRQGA